MRALKPPGTFRWIRGVRTFELDPERLRLQRIRAIIRSIQRDLDEGGRAYVRQIMKGPELFRIELYAQNQIEGMAASSAAQLALLDKFVEAEARQLERELLELEQRLAQNAAELLRLER